MHIYAQAPLAARPEYHPGMLIMHITRSRAVRAFAETGERDEPEAPGLATFEAMQERGLVQSVTPLSRQRSPRSLPAGPRIAASAALEAAEENRNAGVSIVQVASDRDASQLLAALQDDPNVTFASRVPVRYLLNGATALAVPPSDGLVWNLRRVRWREEFIDNLSDVTVAVLDTGIEPDHPDLDGRVQGYDFAHPDIPGRSSDADILGHGTHVAGIIAANPNNALGIVGICSPRLKAWKIFDDEPDYNRRQDVWEYWVDPVMYRRALAECLAEGVDVINLSIGGAGAPDPQELALFEELLDGGTVIVAAMGNDGPLGRTNYPAAIPGVIAVGASGPQDGVASFSSRGNHIALCAPGVGIWSTLPTYPGNFGFANAGTRTNPTIGAPDPRETDYDAWPGTSMATPHVSAAVALLLSRRGAMRPSIVRDRLMESADRVPGMQGRDWDPNYGSGILNLDSLLT